MAHRLAGHTNLAANIRKGVSPIFQGPTDFHYWIFDHGLFFWGDATQRTEIGGRMNSKILGNDEPIRVTEVWLDFDEPTKRVVLVVYTSEGNRMIFEATGKELLHFRKAIDKFEAIHPQLSACGNGFELN